MTVVSESSASAWRKSASFKSALLPMLMTLPMPSFSFAAQSRIATHNAPDCEMTEIFPGGGTDGANVAFIRWCMFRMPRQFGPCSRTPFF